MSTPEEAKAQLRRRLLAARRAVPLAVREAEATALAAAPLPGLPGTVCAYWPVGSEPGSPALLESLRRRGCRVLLPVLGGGRAGPVIDTGPAIGVGPVIDTGEPLNWAEYTGVPCLRAGPLGLLEPAGPRLGCAAIAGAVLVLVPALAVDYRGIRLGRGGGHYDRTLRLARPDTLLVAVVRDAEVVESLPAQPHDVPVNAVLTPGRGLHFLPQHFKNPL